MPLSPEQKRHNQLDGLTLMSPELDAICDALIVRFNLKPPTDPVRCAAIRRTLLEVQRPNAEEAAP